MHLYLATKPIIWQVSSSFLQVVSHIPNMEEELPVVFGVLQCKIQLFELCDD